MAKISQDRWLMTYDPLFDCIFWDDSESLLSLVWFGQIIGQIYVKPGFTGQKWKNPNRSMNYDLWPLVRLHFSRGFRICAKFGLIRSFYRSNARQTGFQRSDMAKIPQGRWLMTFDPLFDCIFWEDSESVLRLVKFGQIIGQIYVVPGFTGQEWQKSQSSINYVMWPTLSLRVWRGLRICT